MAMGRVREDLGFRNGSRRSSGFLQTIGGIERQARERDTHNDRGEGFAGLSPRNNGQKERKRNVEMSDNCVQPRLNNKHYGWRSHEHCRYFGSNLGGIEGPNTKRANGGGRRGRQIIGRLAKAERRGQSNFYQPECIPDDRYGDDDQGGGADHSEGSTLRVSQECQEPMWT
eukprot:15684593-Heterocapsa_arctica.AAC.1